MAPSCLSDARDRSHRKILTIILTTAICLAVAYTQAAAVDIWTSGGTSLSRSANGDWAPDKTQFVGYNSADGEMNITNGATYRPIAWIGAYIGYESGTTGTMNINGGIWDAWSGGQVGKYGTGVMNVTNGGQFLSGYPLRVSAKGTLNIDGGIVAITNHFWSEGEVNLISGTLSITGGDSTVDSRTLTIGSQGIMNIDGGDISLDTGLDNQGTINLTNGATLSLPGGSSTGVPFFNDGTLELVGASTSATVSTFTSLGDSTVRLDGSTMNVTPDGSMVVLGQLEFGDDGGTIDLDDARLNHAEQTLTLCANGQIVGAGEILVGSSGLNLGSTGSAGSVTGTSATNGLAIYGDVSGSGSLTNVTVYGDVSVGNSPGTIYADGLSLTGSGELEMGLGGLIAGDEFDQIVVNGASELDGLLRVVWHEHFQALLGDSFTLFDLTPGGPITGTFDDISLPTFTDASLSWDTSTLYTNGTITAIPEPASLGLLAFGCLAMIHRRKKA